MPALELSSLPFAEYLQPLDGDLGRDGDYTEVHIADAEFTGVDVGNSRVMESAISGATFNEGSFSRVRFSDVWVGRTRWIGTSWAESELLDVTFVDCVIAGVQAFGAKFRRVTFHGCKINSLNLRGSELHDVKFEGCDLTELDCGGATLNTVGFPTTAIRQARFPKATLRKVDFRGASELDVVEGCDSLRGATVDSTQLLELAPALAKTLGIEVKDGR